MKQKLIALLLLAQVFTAVYAQTMTVKPTTGESTAYSLANIRKLTFSGGNLLVTNKTGSNGTFALAGNKNLFFTSPALSTVSNVLERSSFYLYLNPITDVLTIANTDARQMMTDYDIIALDGRILKTKHHINNNEAQVVVSDLPSGVYFCRIVTKYNIQTIKFLNH